MSLPQSPGIYSPFEETDVFWVGPHSRLTRNGIVFNDRTQLECYWVDDFGGFDSPELRVTSQENVEEDGDIPDPGFLGARVMTLTGWIQAGSYPTMIKMSRALSDSLIDLVESPMEISVAEMGIFTQATTYIPCRPTSYNIATRNDPTDITGLIKRPFTVTLRASDPTYKSIEEKSSVLVPTVTTLLGRIYQRTYPLSYTYGLDAQGYPLSSTTNAIDVVNLGNYDAPVRLKLIGAMTSPVVVNQTTGQQMYFRTIASGSSLEVDTSPTEGMVYNEAGALSNSSMLSKSDWMVLKGAKGGFDGSNRIVLYVDSFDPSAQLQIRWNDTTA